MTDPVLIALLCLIFLAAGAIKGAAGMGLPTASISLMTLFLDPRSAIALLLMPMIFSNAWQVFRAGQTIAAARRYLPFALALMIGVGVTVTLTHDAPDRMLLATLGGALLVFVAVNASTWVPHIPACRERAAQIVAGTVAGMMGGLTSVWAPPLAVYLAARRVSKDEFVRASGLLIFLGSLPLAMGYLRQGILTRELALVSTAMLIPTFAGFALGERLRGHLSEQGFRRVLLVIFTFMGLNLLRRGLM